MKPLTETEKNNLAQGMIDLLDKYGIDGWFLLVWDTNEKEGQTYYDGSQDKACIGEFLLRMLTVMYNMIHMSHEKKPGVMVNGPPEWKIN